MNVKKNETEYSGDIFVTSLVSSQRPLCFYSKNLMFQSSLNFGISTRTATE